eukprot:2256779-Prymnesium_polylepis.1
MDPQQRQVLELGYKALHGASQRRGTLMGGNVGVHVAIEHLDWQLLQLQVRGVTALQRTSPFAASGEQGHVASGRLSFAFDLRGPTMCVNTACSSGLVSVHLGAAALSAAECDIGVSPAIKVMLLPFAVALGVLAPDGRSKSFDARADGYGRSENAGALSLAPGDGIGVV